MIFNNRTYVPLRFVSETFDLNVNWDNETKTVSILKPFDDELSFSQHVDRYLTAMNKHKGFNGSIIIAGNDEILFSKGYGYANIEEQIQNTTDTKFLIGSLTEIFIAFSIMQLYEKGLIDLDDFISKYIPDKWYGDILTIKSFLTHTSDIYSHQQMMSIYKMDEEKMTREMIIDINYVSDNGPGPKWEYSHTGYILLGYIVEQISGLSLDEYFQKNIFEPLEMNDTGVYCTSYEELKIATGYKGFLNFEPVEITEKFIKTTFGAGDLYSTVEDLYKLDRALSTEKLLSLKTIDMIFDIHVDMIRAPYYGLGWFIEENAIGKYVHNSGNILGYTSFVVKLLDMNKTIILTMNKDDYNFNSIIENIFRILDSVSYEMPPELIETQIDSKVLQSYVGTYVYLDTHHIIVTESDNQLYFYLGEETKFNIFPMSETEFFNKTRNEYITFNKNDLGEVIGLQYKLMSDFSENSYLTVEADYLNSIE